MIPTLRSILFTNTLQTTISCSKKIKKYITLEQDNLLIIKKSQIYHQTSFVPETKLKIIN